MHLPECKIILVTESGETSTDTSNGPMLPFDVYEHISREISTITSNYYSQESEEYLKLIGEIKKDEAITER